MNWQNSLKVALLQKDLKELEYLIYNMPQFDNIDDLELVNSLMLEAKVLFEEEKKKTSKSMSELRKTKSLLAQENRDSKLNLVF